MIIKKHKNFSEAVCFWNENYEGKEADLIYYIHDYKKRGTKHIKFYTLIYDLKMELSEIVSLMNKSRRKYLNIAKVSPDITYKTLDYHKITLKDIAKAFNSFAKWKGISGIDLEALKKMKNNNKIFVTIVDYKDEPVVGYVYYVDGKTTRQFLKIPFCNKLDNKILSAISSFHIYNDVKLFKEQGFETYDWGGIYKENQSKDKIQGIIDFKKSFGGKKIQIWKNIEILNKKGQKAFEDNFK